MLTIYGHKKSLCDGLARRDFLQLGALGIAGFGEILASLYQHLGIDLDLPHLRDLSGRPQYLVDGHQPLPELG